MKKLLSAALAALLCASLMACSNDVQETSATTTEATDPIPNQMPIPAEYALTASKIINAMWEKYQGNATNGQTKQDITLERFFYPLDHTHIALFVTDFLQKPTGPSFEMIGEFEFRYPDCQQLGFYIYPNQFTTLQSLYRSKLISNDKVEAIWNEYRLQFASLYQDKNFNGIEITRDTLLKTDLTDLEKEIITAMWEQCKSSAMASGLTVNDIPLETLIPCGNGYALKQVDFIPSANTYYREIIAGYDFRYTVPDTLDFYLDGEFCALHKAYTSGKITAEDVGTVWQVFKASSPSLYEGDTGAEFDEYPATIYE